MGWFGGQCGYCNSCRRGDFVTCVNLIIPGLTTHGGYAENVIVEARALAAIPDELPSAAAAPLLCAGVTTFNALRNSRLRSGDLVAIHGIGGLGHLAVQYARHMSFHTVAIARRADNEKLALELGAEQCSAQDAATALQKLGGAHAVLTIMASGKAMGPLIAGLRPRGRLIVVGGSQDPVEVPTTQLILGSRGIQGEAVGTAIDIEDTLRFSVRHNVRPMNEVVDLSQAASAYARMMANEARFRMVLDVLSM